MKVQQEVLGLEVMAILYALPWALLMHSYGFLPLGHAPLIRPMLTLL
jgi:hypothetical protein